MNKKILVGMSGGVDSSVSALLLQKQGYEVVGCTMKLYDKNNEQELSINDAKKVCKMLGIEHHVIDLQEYFYKNVIEYFISEYEKGRTPNPCIQCNKHIKFDKFLEIANNLGCKYIATGHYANIEFSETYGSFVLKQSQEETKDQTYFLYNIKKEDLEKIVFPLSNYKEKEMVKKYAEENGLFVARKKESQEICFISDNDYLRFLHENSNMKETIGNIILDGEIVGKHEGYFKYTIGQRKGLGVSAKEPLFVIGLNPNKNEVIIGGREKLFKQSCRIKDINYLVDKKNIDKYIEDETKLYFKIRYSVKKIEGTIKKIVKEGQEDTMIIDFLEKQRAITPGQSAVIYDKDGVVLAGGIIN